MSRGRTPEAAVILLAASDPAEREATLAALQGGGIRAVTADSAAGAVAAAKDQEAVLRARDELSQLVVHNLKTPLTTMLATLEMLADGDMGELGERQAAAVDDIAASGQVLLGMIDSVLDVARLDSATLPLSFESVAPASVLDALRGAWAARFAREGCDLEVEPTPSLESLRADAGAIHRVLGNLLQNALAHGGRPLRVMVRAVREAGAMRFSVSDNGVGIPASHQATIFDRFVRGPRLPDEGARPRGAGLGLAYCRLATEAHGGRIWLESAPGAGSTFHVTLPIDAASGPVGDDAR